MMVLQRAQADSHSFVVSPVWLSEPLRRQTGCPAVREDPLAVIFDGNTEPSLRGAIRSMGPIGSGVEMCVFQKVVDDLLNQGGVHGNHDKAIPVCRP